jgi:hypothetical protein
MILVCHLPQTLQAVNKVIILGIDGCKPDALLTADAPNLKTLAAEWTVCWHALSRPPTKSGPCWSSIFTGVWNDKHGVTDNNFRNSRYGLYPHVFTRLKEYDPDLRTASLVFWQGINDGLTRSADLEMNGSDEELKDTAIGLIREGTFDVIFVQFGSIDNAGHATGFDTGNADYLKAVEKVDGLAGELIASVQERRSAYDENWLILALSDHGGRDFHHGGSTIEEMNVFIIAAGTNVPQKNILPRRWSVRDLEAPGRGLALSGSGGFVTIQADPSFPFQDDGDFTVEFCIRTSGWSGNPHWVGTLAHGDSKSRGFCIMTYESGTWQASLSDSAKRVNISGPVIADNEWHHLSARFNRRGNLTLFQDGMRIGSVPIGSIGTIRSSRDLGIGRFDSDFFPVSPWATISEMRLWDKALGDTVIHDWIFRPVDESHPEWLHLAGYWKMDDTGGTRATDHSPYGRHGTLQDTLSEWVSPSGQVRVVDIDSSDVLKTVDIAATLLDFLNVPILPEWGLDGKIIPHKTDTHAAYRPASRSETLLLHPNYPNPFSAGGGPASGNHPATAVPYSIGKCTDVTVSIWNVLGQRILDTKNPAETAGSHVFVWDGKDREGRKVSPGIYILRVDAGGESKSVKMKLLH